MTTGAVLCGGAGTRMGRTKHDLVLPGGATLLEHVAGVLREVCGEVVVVGAVIDGWMCVADERDSQGPLAGIEALLGSGVDDDYLVCPCDMPRLTAAPLRALMGEADVRVLKLDGEDRARPLPMGVRVGVLPSVRALLDGGRRAVHGVLEVVEVDIVEGPSEWVQALADVDTQEEWNEKGRSAR